MPYPSRPGEMYRPLCRLCADPALRELPVERCRVCDRQVVLGPAPDRRGLWREWTVVCSFDCLAVAREDYVPPPPAPRRCGWCGSMFTPARRSGARFCSKVCRERNRRARPVVDYEVDAPAVRALLDELGITPGSVLEPRLGDVLAAALNRLMVEDEAASEHRRQ